MHRNVVRSATYLYALRWYIALNAGIFLLSFLLGVCTGVLEPEVAHEVFGGAEGSIQQRVDMLLHVLSVLGVPEWLYFLGFIVLIFLNNTTLSLVAMLMALLPPFFITPLGFVALNGYIVGIVVFFSSSPFMAAVGILPHGIIEIPMILFATSMGTRLGWLTIKWIMGRGKSPKDELLRSIETFLYLIAPMLLLAALVEVIITGSLLYVLNQ
ncbi:stage II sporulation protein M [Methermicoccus shengliensis]|uniref:Stage II sporulation protein M n=1 Tax=Methermicoccus shengliensis TaxID=660064 RepID=A0A832RXE7_9EURY|nr:stage II sporulation protein M [Methermicoccus shengliensis]KUK04932.1 MAG: hypothetical protein XD46_0278 [Euryarchaeota archaeon 55_53]KUK30909.1 MAG: hypothetical protein XD62_0051 [Methanosarcinales archeaon 56_1174]MDI3487630.1 stage sporulation protein [Methanosarcinales archaeon]MDN5294963.1 stage sporulation protein [Methanosarcinales archaeon]HIH69968.1 hypothetical protein [Methermicoccus shengliensis]